MTAAEERRHAAEVERDERIAAIVDAAPPPSQALLDRIYELLEPEGGTS
jgi:hypothetical protein